MIELFASAYGSAKAALDIAEGYVSLKTETARNEAVINIQRSVLEYQRTIGMAEREYAAGLKRIDALEAEIVRLKDWSAEKQRYELADAGNGCLAYRLKAGMGDGEPPHWLCPNCYEDGKKSILQPQKHPGLSETLDCPRCQTRLLVRGRSDFLTDRSGGRR